MKRPDGSTSDTLRGRSVGGRRAQDQSGYVGCHKSVECIWGGKETGPMGLGKSEPVARGRGVGDGILDS